MPSRSLQCLAAGEGSWDDKRESHTQCAHAPRVAQDHSQCSVPSLEGHVGAFAPLLQPTLVFGVQFISRLLLLTNLFVPLATVLSASAIVNILISLCRAVFQHCLGPLVFALQCRVTDQRQNSRPLGN